MSHLWRHLEYSHAGKFEMLCLPVPIGEVFLLSFLFVRSPVFSFLAYLK